MEPSPPPKAADVMLSAAMGKQTEKGRKQHKKGKQQPRSEYQQLKKGMQTNLPFSGMKFFKWIVIWADAFYCYGLVDSFWQEAVVQQGHSEVYFIFFAFIQVALAQLFFAAIYYLVKFFARFYRP